MKDIQAIIFDMDGVIADSEPLHLQAEHTILRQYGIEAPWSEWHIFTGLTERAVFQHIVDHFTDGSYAVEELMEAKHSIFLDLLATKLQPVPGSLDFIKWGREQYAQLALTTSSTQTVQQKIFDLFDIHAYFDIIVTGDHIQHGKPHPEPYLKTVDALQVPASHCLVMEDSLNGITSAKQAGCHVAGITTSFSTEQLQDGGADVVISAFSELYAYLA